MKAMIKVMTVVSAILSTTMNLSMAAYADSDYTRDEIVDEYWTEYWENSLPGEENPEGSLEYHILESFLDEQYGHTWVEDKKYLVLDWSSDTDIRNAWQTYHDDYTKHWHYVDDDETGEFYIESYDPETDTYGGDKLYTFTLADGEWHMVDSNGNIVDSFKPHGGDGSWAKLNEDDSEEDMTYDVGGYVNGEYHGNDDTASQSTNEKTDEKNTNVENEPTQGGERVVGKLDEATDLTDSEKVIESDSDNKNTEKKDEDNSSLLYVLGGLVLIGAAAIGYLVFKKQKGEKR